MRAFMRDARQALRQLGKAPGFTLTTILTLAVGIGATTAIFTLVYDVLLRPLPFDHAGQLVRMQERVAEIKDLYPNLPMNANHFEMWQRNAKTVQAMTVMDEQSVPLGIGGHPQQVKMVSATPGIFAVFGVSPSLGRAFTEQEATPGHERVAVLMHDLWRTQFHSDPAILGKTIRLNGFEYTVIGVMPEDFYFPSREARLWTPMRFSADAFGDRTNTYIFGFA
ncbi:MAG TPA: ABC transporter permease, partial [Terracidiphilus sp.]|nr:ABC transporter permease [Terracidiphilus sp.]